jgi:hypothetical protein
MQAGDRSPQVYSRQAVWQTMAVAVAIAIATAVRGQGLSTLKG